MKVNKQAFEVVGVTYEEYIHWCDETHKKDYLNKTKKEFFDRIRDGRLVRDGRNGKLVPKRINIGNKVDKNEINS